MSERRTLTVAYVGNFTPEWSTESAVASALQNLGHRVIAVSELTASAAELQSAAHAADLVLWTHTHQLGSLEAQWQLVELTSRPPLIGLHLDRWWGLARESDIFTHPFFKCDVLWTADGGHEQLWREAGVTHRWLLPALDARGTDTPARVAASPIIFVGNFTSYHPEWPHRAELVAHLREWYGDKFAALPAPGAPRLVGQQLTNLYSAARVVVGDSCLAGNADHYFSDRVPETVGRGGFLLHPAVQGLEYVVVPGRHVITWSLGDWQELRELTSRALRDEAWCHQVASAGCAHVRQHHTWESRLRVVIATSLSS